MSFQPLPRGCTVFDGSEKFADELAQCVVSDDKRALLRLLLVERANPNAVDSSGQTALIRVAHAINAEMTKTLLRAKAAVNAATADNRTALHKVLVSARGAGSSHAITIATEYIIKMLLSAHADPNVQSREMDPSELRHGETPLHMAAAFGRPQLAEPLLEARADISLTTASGHTAMDRAMGTGIIPAWDNAQIRDASGATAIARRLRLLQQEDLRRHLTEHPSDASAWAVLSEATQQQEALSISGRTHHADSMFEQSLQVATAQAFQEGWFHDDSQLCQSDASGVNEQDQAEFCAGVFVKILGLQSRPELNGQVGRLTVFNMERQRWGVALSPDAESHSVAVKLSNLKRAHWYDFCESAFGPKTPLAEVDTSLQARTELESEAPANPEEILGTPDASQADQSPVGDIEVPEAQPVVLQPEATGRPAASAIDPSQGVEAVVAGRAMLELAAQASIHRLGGREYSREIHEAVQASNQQGECVICMERDATFVGENCGHLVSCTACRRRLVHEARIKSGASRDTGQARREISAKGLQQTSVLCPMCRSLGRMVDRSKFKGRLIVCSE